MLNNKLSKFTLFAFVFVTLQARAVDGLRSEFQFSGLLTDSTNGDAPIANPSIVLKIGIYNPSADCLLYEETHTVDTSTSGGRFSVLVGTGTATGTGANLALRNALLTNLTVSSGTSGCSSGYVSSAGDIRKMKVNMHPSGHAAEDLSPLFTIAASPTALVAESLSDGLTSDKILKVNSAQMLTQSSAESVFSQLPTLTALLSGNSNLYAKNNVSSGTSIVSSSTTPAGAAAGSIWYDNTSNQLKYYNGSSAQTLSTTAGGGGTVTSVSGTAPITISNGTTTPNISISAATTSSAGVVTLATNGGTTAGTVVQADDTRLSNARSPAGTSLNSAQLWIGSSGNIATAVNMSGDATISNLGSLTLANSGITSGTYTKVTVDSKGRVIANGTTNITDIQSTVSGNWFNASGACTPGTRLEYSSVSDTISCQSFALTYSQVTTALGFTPANSSNSVQKSGDTMTGALNLPTGGLNVGSSQFVVLADGKVGIGDPAPETNFKVAGGNSSTLIRVVNSSSTLARYPGLDVVNYAGGVGGNPTISLKNYNGSGGTPTAATAGMTLGEITAYGGDGSASALKSSAIRFIAEENFNATSSGGGIRFFTTPPTTNVPTERIAILGSGNVGIGTTTPNAKLDVNGDIWALNLKTTGVYGNAVPLKLGISATEHMRIDTSGNVGIGVLSPSDKLHVYSTSSNLLKLETTAVASDILLSHGGGSSKIKSENLSGPTLQFDAGNDSTPEMTIKSATGNVGIATASPAYKLDVNGDISASGCLRSSAGVASGSCSSDIRLKHDFRPFQLGLNSLTSINPMYFKYNGLGEHSASEKDELGVIAQEVEQSAPELITKKLVILHPEDEQKTEIKQVNYTAFTYILINSVKELYAKWMNDSQNLHQELEIKDQKIKELEARLERLEKRLESK